MNKESHAKTNVGSKLRDFILGAQDGIVNVLGLVLGVAAATLETKTVLIAGIAGLFAESISMGAVAFTSSKAARDFYRSEVNREKREMKEVPTQEKKEIENIYKKKGFSGKALSVIVNKITSNKKIWLNTMIEEELNLSKDEYKNPFGIGMFVFWATVLGSIIPILPFFFLSVRTGIFAAVALSGLALFIMGYVKGKITIGGWKSGVEMLLVGLISAIAGYFIGIALGILIK